MQSCKHKSGMSGGTKVKFCCMSACSMAEVFNAFFKLTLMQPINFLFLKLNNKFARS